MQDQGRSSRAFPPHPELHRQLDCGWQIELDARAGQWEALAAGAKGGAVVAEMWNLSGCWQELLAQ